MKQHVNIYAFLYTSHRHVFLDIDTKMLDPYARTHFERATNLYKACLKCFPKKHIERTEQFQDDIDRDELHQLWE